LCKFGFVVPLFVITGVLPKPHVKWSTCLPYILLIAVGACQLVYAAFFIFFCWSLFCWDKSLPIVFCVLKATLRVVCLERLVMNFVSLPICLNLAHLVLFSSVLVLFVNGVSLVKSEGSYLLLYNICFIVLASFSLLLIFRLKFPFYYLNTLLLLVYVLGGGKNPLELWRPLSLVFCIYWSRLYCCVFDWKTF
jgi:hypothetical protein